MNTEISIEAMAHEDFETTCRLAGVEPTEERWQKRKTMFLADAKERWEHERLQVLVDTYAETRLAFLRSLNAIVEQHDCYIDTDKYGQGTYIYHDEHDELTPFGLTPIRWEPQTGRYVVDESPTLVTTPSPEEDNPPGVEDDEVD